MSPIQRSVAKVRRRVFVASMLRGLGWALLAGLTASAVVLAVDKLLPLTVVPLLAYAVIAGLGLVFACSLATRGLPNEADAAVLLDDKLGLKDKLGTALYTAKLDQQNALTDQIAREADEAAKQARTMVAKAVPVGLTKVWNSVPVGIAAVLLVFFLMPEADPLGQVAAAEAKEAEEELVEQASEVIINTVDTDLNQRDEDDDGTQIAQGLPEELQDQLVSISDEMKRNPQLAEEKLQEAESLISDAEDRLGEQVDVVEAAFNPLQNDASALDAGQQGPADQFTQAMNRSDFEAAQEAIEQMQEQIDNGDFTEQEQQQLQQQLNNLSQQLQQQASNAQQRQQQQAQQQMQQQLQQQGMSASQAQQLSQQMAQQMQQQQQNQQGQQGQQQQGNQQQGQQQAQGNQQGQQNQQGGQQQMTQQQMQQQLQQALQQQGMSQQQAQQQAQQMMQQMQQQMQQAQGQGQSGQMQQQLGQGLQQMAQQMGQQGQGQQNQQGQQAGQQGQQQGQGGGQSAQQAINQMAQMQQQLQRMQQQQGQMQQAMNQLNQMQQGGGVGGQQGGTGDGGNPYGAHTPGYQHQSYAASDIQQGEGRVIASWLENGEVAAGEAAVEYNAARTQAVQAAERAVTEDRVPRRYHDAVKDYFQQLPEDPNAGRAPAAPR